MQRASVWIVSGIMTCAVGACGTASTPPPEQVESADGGFAADGGVTGDGASTGDSGDVVDSSSDSAFVTAPHEPFPPLQSHAGAVLTAPHLVTITYANDPNRQKLEDFGAFVVTSSWMTSTGKDYGVGAGTHTAYRLTENAPTTITDTQITDKISALIAAASIPAPTATNNQVTYLFYTPNGTTVNDGSNLGVLCGANGYEGYHSTSTDLANVDYPYAVIPDCWQGTDFGSITSTSAHEIIEAATDPWGPPNEGFYVDPSAPSLWWAAYPNEVADLCQYEDNVTDTGWTVQRSWSMSAAAAGGSPCVPVPAGEIYFNVTASPTTMPKVPAGGSATFTLTGWSTAAMADWKIAVDVADRQGAFNPKATLDKATINNGLTATVTLTAPATAKSGKIGAAYVQSGDKGHFWPVAIQVQ